MDGHVRSADGAAGVRLAMKTERKSRFSPRRAFVLFEVMLGVAIFSIGIIALGRCVNNCIVAESAREESERARLALENRMAEIEGGEMATDKERSDDLEDAFAGITLKQSRHAVEAKNEKNAVINNLYQVDLEADWTTENEPQSKDDLILRPAVAIGEACVPCHETGRNNSETDRLQRGIHAAGDHAGRFGVRADRHVHLSICRYRPGGNHHLHRR